MNNFPPNYNNYINNNIDEYNFNNTLENKSSDSSDGEDDKNESDYEYEYDYDDSNIIVEDNSISNQSIKEYNLIIDGKDRNWFNINPNRYSFEIIFNPNVNSIEYKKYPIFENNQYLPATKEQSRLGQRGNENTTGFIYNCIQYLKWNPYQRTGKIIGYDTIATKYYATNDLKCFKNFKNIHSIQLIETIIPHFNKSLGIPTNIAGNDNIFCNILGNPYIILSIEEFKANYFGSSNIIDNAFAVLGHPTNLTPLQQTGFKNYTSLITIGGGIKTFSPPLTSLNKLTIQLLKPNGEMISNEKDNLKINKIYGSDTILWNAPRKKNLILLEVDAFFDPKEYNIGDKILIKNLKIPTNFLNFSNFNNFLNLESGHEIIGVTSTKTNNIPSIAPFKPDPFLPNTFYCNAIIIHAPIDDLKIKNGLDYNECLNDWYINSNGPTTIINFKDQTTLTSIKNDYQDSNNLNTNIESYCDYYFGKILNLNLQPIFCFKITTYENI